MEDRNIVMAERLAASVRQAGGTVYYVGGYVRDRLAGVPSKDIDVEVHGISPDTLDLILAELGTPVEMGRSFGITGLKHYTLDIAFPRDTGNRIAPFIGEKAAASRRDFTVNALMQNVLTGEVLDFFDGVGDLNRGIIRHVSDRTFSADPLRVFRAAQLSSRFGFSVAPETVKLCGSTDTSGLSRERVMAEVEKVFLRASRPSVFFAVLRHAGQLGVWFPEVGNLIGIEQDPFYHPEGDVWNHTMLVLDAAAGLRSQAEYPLGLMFSALCHDFGKVSTTFRDGERIRSYNHERAGVPIARQLISRLTNEEPLMRYVLNMVENHMRPNLLAVQQSGWKATNRMFDESVSPGDLLLLAKADHEGQKSAADYTPTAVFLEQRLNLFNDIMSKPFVSGQDLIDAGLKPGPEFRDALAFSHRLRLAAVNKEEALAQTLAFIRDRRGKKTAP